MLCSQCMSATSTGVLSSAAANYYKYSGSFTTPPCTEGVKWFVSETSQRASEDQINKFVAAFNTNARPVQNRNGRTVTKYTTA